MPESGKTKRDVEAGGEAGLRKAAELVRETAARDIPIGDPSVDPDPSFALREHGHIVIEPGGRTALVIFEGPYARVLHDDLDREHPRGGRAKFLEAAVLAIVPKFQSIVASEVKRRLGGVR